MYTNMNSCYTHVHTHTNSSLRSTVCCLSSWQWLRPSSVRTTLFTRREYSTAGHPNNPHTIITQWHCEWMAIYLEFIHSNSPIYKWCNLLLYTCNVYMCIHIVIVKLFVCFFIGKGCCFGTESFCTMPSMSTRHSCSPRNPESCREMHQL